MGRKRNFEPDPKTPYDARKGQVTGKAPGINPTIEEVTRSLRHMPLEMQAKRSADALNSDTSMLASEKSTIG
jgi:hypothetical protein